MSENGVITLAMVAGALVKVTGLICATLLFFEGHNEAGAGVLLATLAISVKAKKD